MEELIRKRDLEGLKKYFATSRESFSDLLYNEFRGLCLKQTAVQTLQDMFEVSGIGRCERLFGILEENMYQFKQSPLVETSQTPILRMCNDLLKRLSRSAETSFCGRILFFLSRYLPLSEKSGLNLMGHFNTQNVTKFDTSDTQPVDLINTSDEEIETGEIKETKDISIPVDHALYSMFWQMQFFFSNPIICFDRQQWATFQKNTTVVLGVFSSYKLEKSGSDDDDSEKKKMDCENIYALIDESDTYFAKYLTNPKLLQLQLNDSQFRRYFLIQFIILCQFVTSKTKQKNTSLNDDQTKFINESQEKCYRLLRETHPKGAHFAESVKHILQRELEWAEWKSESCPNMADLADKQPMQPYKKENCGFRMHVLYRRPRTTFDPSVIDIGTTELTKLWSIEPDLLSACKNERRKFTPFLVNFLRDPIDELDPEQQVEDQYKSTRDPAFQFRACRLLMVESSQYISAQSQQTLSIPQFLDNVILRTGKIMDEFRTELQDREERQARKAVEESLLRNRSNGVEGKKNEVPNVQIYPVSYFWNAVILSCSFYNAAKYRGFKDGDDKEARLSRRRRMMERTEISSDEEESPVSDDRISDASGGEYEIEDILRMKAKEYLQKLHECGKTEDEVGETLKNDAANRAGTLYRQLADLVELYDEEEVAHRGHRFTPLSVAMSPCEKYVVSSGKDSRIIKYDIAARKIVGIIRRTKSGGKDQNAHYGHIFSISVSPDGKFIVSGGYDAIIKVWDFITMVHFFDLKGHRGPITALCFQLRTNFLFSASRDRSVKLWDLDQKGLVDTMYGHHDSVVALSALQKQRVVTAGRQDKSCRLWKVEDETQLLFNGNSTCISMDCVSMLNDDHFVSGSTDGSLYVWSIWKKKPLVIRSLVHGMRAPGIPRWVVCISAVPFSGEYFIHLVATGSDDGELKLWKIGADFKSIFQTGFINDVRFSMTGSFLSVAVGQEHRDGRWWVEKKARNQIVIIPTNIDREVRRTETNGIRLIESTSSSGDDDDV
ncbi:WD domain, G-beta repeat protein [Dictyocaulus viviparus]|uniref:WD domain, G-beta repeat protein n=1 Tax=Dictyocaulus viviparus TaxID=29172 RepID=A0A0D8XIT8_DICVI|nr:WD domain, G-beta repeat protein [Dictyocaulus viviparus]